MRRIKARFFDGQVSAGHSVAVDLIDGSGLRFAIDGRDKAYPASLIDVEYPVANSGFIIHLSDHAILETDDSEDVEHWWGPIREHGVGLVAEMERRWPLALGTLVAVVAAMWWALTSGIPIVAKHVSRVIPQDIEQFIGDQGMNLLDEEFLYESQLPPERQQVIATRFERITSQTSGEHEYILYFRDGGALGANALALPSGIIVITDQLVELSEHNDEIEAVLAHEVGHIENRHTLRMILQSSGSAALFVAVFGDLDSAVIISSSIPTVLVNSAYSREFETEADNYAYGYLDDQHIPRSRFGDILLRIDPPDGESTIGDFLSSHPRSDDRVSD